MNYIAIPGLKYKGRIELRGPEVITKVVCAFFKCSQSELTEARRKRLNVDRKRVYMYCLRNMTTLTTSEIAALCGYYDYTAVIHGLDKCNDLIQSDPQFKHTIESVQQLLY